MEKTIEEKQLDKIKAIAVKNGWKEGNHVFNYLTEIQMHKYDVLQRKIDIQNFIKENEKKKIPITINFTGEDFENKDE